MDKTAIRVLEELRGSEAPLASRELGDRTKITPQEVTASVRRLRKYGYRIRTVQRGIYQFEQGTPKLLPHEVLRVLRTDVIGHQMQYYEKITSTSTVAKDLIATHDPATLHGMVIIAEEQTGGTGRLGRAWISPGGGIWTTLILIPRIPVDRLFMLTMVGAIAAVRAIKKVTGIGSLIKWPNDIYIGNRKVGGIITELSADGPIVHYCLVGMGIDVNIPLETLPARLRESATSLSAELGREVERAPLLASLLREFELRYHQIESGEYDPIVREWKSLSCTLEHRVRINLGSRSFEGDAIDIDDYGALIVRKDSGAVERVIAGDCLHL